MSQSAFYIPAFQTFLVVSALLLFQCLLFQYRPRLRLIESSSCTNKVLQFSLNESIFVHNRLQRLLERSWAHQLEKDPISVRKLFPELFMKIDFLTTLKRHPYLQWEVKWHLVLNFWSNLQENLTSEPQRKRNKAFETGPKRNSQNLESLNSLGGIRLREMWVRWTC